MDVVKQAQKDGVPYGLVSKAPLTWFKSPTDKSTKLGQGSFGSVYKYTIAANNAQVAVKVSYGLGLFVEMALLGKFTHPNIVPLLDAFVFDDVSEGRSTAIVLPLYDGNLKQRLDKQNLSLRQKKVIMAQILHAVAYLHSENVLHGDLKPQNILLREENGDITAVISDFGIAILGSCYPSNPINGGDRIMTLYYRSPELLLEAHYESPADMWALGCILYEIITNKILFAGDSAIDQLFKIFMAFGTPNTENWPGVNTLPEWRASYPVWKPKNSFENQAPDLRQLLLGLLAMNPSKRITPEEALASPFFDEIRDQIHSWGTSQRRGDCLDLVAGRECYNTDNKRSPQSHQSSQLIPLNIHLETEKILRDVQIRVGGLLDDTIQLAKQLLSEFIKAQNITKPDNYLLLACLTIATQITNDLDSNDLVIILMTQKHIKFEEPKLTQYIEAVLAIHGIDLFCTIPKTIISGMLTVEEADNKPLKAKESLWPLLNCAYATQAATLFSPSCVAIVVMLLALDSTKEIRSKRLVQFGKKVGTSIVTECMVLFAEQLQKIPKDTLKTLCNNKKGPFIADIINKISILE